MLKCLLWPKIKLNYYSVSEYVFRYCASAVSSFVLGFKGRFWASGILVVQGN